MKSVISISLAAGLAVVFVVGESSARSLFSQISPATTRLVAADALSEPLEFDENGVVTNLDYPNVIETETPELALTASDTQVALKTINRVMPPRTTGANLGLSHHIPVNRRLSAHVAAGAFFDRGGSDSDLGISEDNEKSVDPMLQLGATYKLAPGLTVTAELQRYFVDEDKDLQRYAVGVVYNY